MDVYAAPALCLVSPGDTDVAHTLTDGLKQGQTTTGADTEDMISAVQVQQGNNQTALGEGLEPDSLRGALFLDMGVKAQN